MQRVEINHSIKVIELNPNSAFASSANNKLLQTEIIDNAKNSFSGDISLPITTTPATVQTPVALLMLIATDYFYVRITIGTDITPIIRTKSFQYSNDINPIDTVELWNGTLSLVGTTFSVLPSTLPQLMNVISLN